MKPIFLSHCSHDKEIVIRLRQALEAQKLPVWMDSRNLRAGQTLTDELKNAIQEAGAFLIFLSLEVFNSPWVLEELQWALKKQKQEPEFPVIPLMLPGFEPRALRTGTPRHYQYSVAEYGDDIFNKAMLPIRRELENHPTLLILDNNDLMTHKTI